MTLKAVIFDMGSTLLQRPDDREALNRAMNAGLWTALTERYPRVPLPPCIEFHDLLSAELERYDAATFSRADMLADLVAEQGWDIDAADPALMRAWHQPMIDQGSAEPDLAHTLDTLQALGLRLAVVSNTGWPGPYRDRELAHFGILDYFPIRLYSCDLGIGKPDPRIFRAALDRLGDVPSDAAIYVGDSLKNDVAGAHRVGLWTAWLAPAHTTTAPEDAATPPDLVLTALRELPTKLTTRFSVSPAPPLRGLERSARDGC
jgi:HAD superfamily hydrolase (TIGR01549 family)